MISYAEDIGEECLNICVVCFTFANCAVLQYAFKFCLSYQGMISSGFFIQDSHYLYLQTTLLLGRLVKQ